MFRRLPYFVVNAFTDKPFSGNAAAVCWVSERQLSEEIMQSVASEINLSETCFIYDKKGQFGESQKFGLRWFTPTNEVPLCGHATLAAAATLFYEANNINSVINFVTASGNLFARKNEDLISLDFPCNNPEPIDKSYSSDVLNHLFSKSNLINEIEKTYISHSAKKLLVHMKKSVTRAHLEAFNPELKNLHLTHDGSVFKGIIITCKGSDNYDFFSRYFAPWNGIPEDPVTGSAHTVLAPYWSKLLNKNEMRARQCSMRGGDVVVKLRDDDRVDLNGSILFAIKGELAVPEENE